MTPDEARNVLLHACDDLNYIDIRHQDEEWYEVMHEVVDLILAEPEAILLALGAVRTRHATTLTPGSDWFVPAR